MERDDGFVQQIPQKGSDSHPPQDGLGGGNGPFISSLEKRVSKAMSGGLDMGLREFADWDVTSA